MQINYYRDILKDQLTGFGLLESELDDAAWDKVINLSLQEMMRYYDSTCLVQVPAESCIDLTKVEENNNIKISSVANIYRTKAMGDSDTARTSWTDPMSIAMWQTGGGYYNWNRFASNYAAYSLLQQISNTLSTDLAFKEDLSGRKLYVNIPQTAGELVIEYIPRLETVDQVVGDYWIDILKKLSLAHAKIALGRIRTRFKQDGALWTDDGETMLSEGKEELKELTEKLRTKASTPCPVD